MIPHFGVYYVWGVIFVTLPNLVQNNRDCISPYECLTTHRCSQKYYENAHDLVLFRCKREGEICCPTSVAKINQTQVIHNTEPTHHNTSFPKYEGNITKDGEWQNKNSSIHCDSCGKKKTSGSSTTPTTSKSENRFSSHKNYGLLPSKCGEINLPDRIIEGEEAGLAEFPWMTLVGIKDRDKHEHWICGGTLINSRYILTAAHCILQENRSRLLVRLGEHNLENPRDCDKNNFCLDAPQDFIVEETIVHENWNSTTIKNDIALLRLPRDIPDSLSMSPICLPLHLEKNNSSEEVKFNVAGWGKTDWNPENPPSSVLRKAILHGMPNTDCNICKGKRKETYCPITSTQICAQGWKSMDVCKGDSGGPLMTFNARNQVYQVGITSFKASEYCGADNIPSIFTRVESYIQWILDNIRK